MKTALDLLHEGEGGGTELFALDLPDYHVGVIKRALALVAERAREDMRETATQACNSLVDCYRCEGRGAVITGRGVRRCGICYGRRQVPPTPEQCAAAIRALPVKP